MSGTLIFLRLDKGIKQKKNKTKLPTILLFKTKRYKKISFLLSLLLGVSFSYFYTAYVCLSCPDLACYFTFLLCLFIAGAGWELLMQMEIRGPLTGLLLSFHWWVPETELCSLGLALQP